jgi:hypothetical protein
LLWSLNMSPRKHHVTYHSYDIPRNVSSSSSAVCYTAVSVPEGCAQLCDKVAYRTAGQETGRRCLYQPVLGAVRLESFRETDGSSRRLLPFASATPTGTKRSSIHVPSGDMSLDACVTSIPSR